MKIFCLEKNHDLKASFSIRREGGGGGGDFFIRLMGMCRWMGSHFNDLQTLDQQII